MPIEFINPENLFNSKIYGFSQVAVCQQAGKIFTTAEQVALNANEEIVGRDLASQTHQALFNIKKCC